MIMPKRTSAERALIDSSIEKPADELCNARTSNFERPYCKMKAGYNTDHLGKGRCYLHGGRAGAPIVTAIYSKKLNSTLKEEYDKLIVDPELVNLRSELAVMKAMFGNFLGQIKELILDVRSDYKVEFGGCYMFEAPSRPYMVYAY